MKRRQTPLLRQLHRWLGVISALFVLLLVISGWMLNHTERLALDTLRVNTGWLLDWYGMHPATEPVSYRTGGHRLTWLEGRLYLDATNVTATNGPLVGAVAMPDMLAGATANRIYLMLSDGRLVEKIDVQRLIEEPLVGIGLTENGQLALNSGEQTSRLNLDTLTIQPLTGESVHWSAPVPLPATLRAKIMQDWRGQGLPLERVVQDLHSGRILGLGGTLFMDLIGLLLAGLAVTGLLIWLRRPG